MSLAASTVLTAATRLLDSFVSSCFRAAAHMAASSLTSKTVCS
jgi:hypothetical protein